MKKRILRILLEVSYFNECSISFVFLPFPFKLLGHMNWHSLVCFCVKNKLYVKRLHVALSFTQLYADFYLNILAFYEVTRLFNRFFSWSWIFCYLKKWSFCPYSYEEFSKSEYYLKIPINIIVSIPHLLKNYALNTWLSRLFLLREWVIWFNIFTNHLSELSPSR